MFCDPGDTVVAEAPSYVGALGVFRAYQAEAVHTPRHDADGLDPVALAETLSRLQAAGRTVKLLYTVPNHQNPGSFSVASTCGPSCPRRSTPRRCWPGP